MAENWFSFQQPASQPRVNPYEVDSDSWLPYRWAGDAERSARSLGLARGGFYGTQDEYDALMQRDQRDYRDQQAEEDRRRRAYEQASEDERRTMQRKWTKGEMLAVAMENDDVAKALFGNAGRVASWFARLAGDAEKSPGASSFGQGVSDFTRSAGTSFAQGMASTVGAAYDLFTGQAGQGQDYTIRSNMAKQYYNPGGVAQTIGGFADDITLGLATMGVGTALTGVKTGVQATATAPTLFGRVIAPLATSSQRVVGAASGALPTAVQVLPETVAGRMNIGEAAASTALGAAGGALSIGSWGGGRLANIASDAAVNTVAGGVQGFTPLLPGGQEMNWEEYWKSLAYGAALGTAFGIAGAKPDPTANRSAVFGQRFDPNAVPPAGPNPEARFAGPQDVMRKAQEYATGRSTIYEGMTTADAASVYDQYRAEELKTIQRNPDGSVQSLSDAVARGAVPEDVDLDVVQEAANLERRVYTSSLAQSHPPEVLIPLLELNIPPGSTPEQVAAAINNEWVNQAVNGKGIDGVEQRLAAAGLASPIDGYTPKQGQSSAVAPPAAPTAAAVPEGAFMPWTTNWKNIEGRLQDQQSAPPPELEPAVVQLNAEPLPVQPQPQPQPQIADPLGAVAGLPTAVPPEMPFRLSDLPLRTNLPDELAAALRGPAPESVAQAGKKPRVRKVSVIQDVEAAPKPDVAVEPPVVAERLKPRVSPEEAVHNASMAMAKAARRWSERLIDEEAGRDMSRKNAVADAEAKRQIASLIQGEPQPIPISGKASGFIKFLADAEGLYTKGAAARQPDVAALRRGIKSGKYTELADGAIEIYNDPALGYVARFKGDVDSFADAYRDVRSAIRANRMTDFAEAAEVRQRRKASAMDKAYEDLASAYEEDAGVGSMGSPDSYLDGGLGLAGLAEFDPDGTPVGVSVESAGSLAQAEYEGWKQKIGGLQRSAASAIWRAMESATGLDLPAGLAPKHIEFYLMSKLGPDGWSDVGSILEARNTSPEVRQFLDENVPKVLSGDKVLFPDSKGRDAARRARQQVFRLNEENQAVPQGKVQKAMEARIDLAEDTREAANIIAEKSGVEPNKIVDMLRRESMRGKKTREAVMPQAEADAVRSAVEASATPEVIEAIDRIKANLNSTKGQSEWARIFSENALPTAEQYKWSLRSLQPLRSVVMVGGWALYNQAVQNLSDDETYFGIPGSVLKDLLGDQEAMTYAMMGSIPFMRGRTKASNRTNTKAGFVNRLVAGYQNVAARGISAYQESAVGRASARRSMARLSPEEFRAAAEQHVTKNTAFTRGTAEYEREVQNYMNIHRMADNPTAKVGKNKGTVGAIENELSDLNLMRAKIPFVEEYIGKVYDKVEVVVRGLSATLKKDVYEGVGSYGDIMRRYRRKNDSRIVDAIMEFDYRASDIAGAKTAVTDETYTSQINALDRYIMERHFTGADGVVDAAAWQDYKSAQTSLDKVRSAHIAALIGMQEGVPYYEIKAKAEELRDKQASVQEAVGAMEGYLENAQKSYDTLNEEIKVLVKSKQADEKMPGWNDARRAAKRDVRKAQKDLDNLKDELETITSTLEKLDSIEAAQLRSMKTGYILRHRNGNAPYVLRMFYDQEMRIAGVRREYSTEAQAKMAEIDLGREFITEVQAKRTAKIESEIATIDAELAAGAKNPNTLEQKKAQLEAEIIRMSGRKPTSEMTALEILDLMKEEKIISNVYANTGRKAKANKSAKKAILDAIHGAAKLEAMAAARLFDESVPGAFVRSADATGNSSLASSATDDVVMFSSKKKDEVPTVDQLVEAIDEMVDGTIDTDQLRKVLEEKVTYASKGSEGGRTQYAIHIDMPALRHIVGRYLEPSIPNLAKRENVIGYYNPDGTWAAKQRWDYLSKSVEAMTSQVHAYTMKTSMRGVIDNALSVLEKYNVNNGLREFVAQYTLNDSSMSEIASAAMSLAHTVRRGFSIATLVTSLTSAAFNRIAGMTTTVGHAGMQATAKYGVRQSSADGTVLKTEWMPSEMQAREFVRNKQAEGDNSWSVQRGFTLRNGVVRQLATAAAVMTAPKQAIKFLARNDPYWKAVLTRAEELNLFEGSALGDYAMRDAIGRGSTAESLLTASTYITSTVERANNWGSILASASTALSRMGLTPEDFAALGRGQITEAVDLALAPHKERLELHAKAAETTKVKIAQLEAELSDSSTPSWRRDEIQELIKLGQKMSAEQSTTPQGVLLDALMEFIVFDRRFEQGGWTKWDKSNAERILEQNPIGVLGLTMSAPVFRSMGAWSAMFREMRNTEGRLPHKLARYAPAIAGAGIVTALAGIRATPLGVLPVAFAADIAGLGEWLWEIFGEDDEDKLARVTGRQMWEEVGAMVAEKNGMDPQFGSDFVRAVWSEGLIKYTLDLNVGNDGGISDGMRVPGFGIWSTMGKNMLRTFKAYGDTKDFFEVLYNTTNLLPTSLKRASQAGLQFQKGRKLDRLGGVIPDELATETISFKDFSIKDAAQHALFGKKWSEIRRTLLDMEGGVGVYTAEDRVVFANKMAGTEILSFGGGLSSKRGPKEQSVVARFEQDAYHLQRHIRNVYQSKYESQASATKQTLADWFAENPVIHKGEDGRELRLSEAMVIAARSNNKTEAESAKQGSALTRERKAMLSDADAYVRARALHEAVSSFYQARGESVDIKVSKDALEAADPLDYVKRQFAQRFLNAYSAGQYRREGRQKYGGYTTP